MTWIIVGLIALAGGIQITSVVGVEYYQAKRNARLLGTFELSQEPSRTLVAYFSRSGNTELMAYQIAEVRKANILNIQAIAYKVGYKGWVNAMADARKTEAAVKPVKADLSTYDTVYIGSPIWLYSPAPPVFEFVGNNDFTGKKVVLFNTLNSKFEQRYIDAFSSLVRQRGGEFAGHLHITRGRMTRQMDPGPFLDSVKTLLIR